MASFPVMPWNIPINHSLDAGQVGRVLFDMRRFFGLRKYGSRKNIDSGVSLIVAEAKDSAGEHIMEVFSNEDDVELWKLVDKVTVENLRHVSPRIARDLIAAFENDDVEDEDERESLRKSMTPSSVIERAVEMGMRVRYAVGNLMDWVAKGEHAWKVLKELKLNKAQLAGAWELMYKGKVDMPSI